jgi:hypothetical protein
MTGGLAGDMQETSACACVCVLVCFVCVCWCVLRCALGEQQRCAPCLHSDIYVLLAVVTTIYVNRGV